MNKEEILNKYINLIDKGYCSDCNELNCIDNFPQAKITHAIRKLQQENQQLKDNWNELKKWLRIKDILANSKINPQSIKFKDLLKHMEYLEKER